MKTKNPPKRPISRLDGTMIPPKSISTIVAALAILVLAAVAAAQNQSFAIPIGSGAEPPLFSGLGPFNPSDARVTAPFMVSGTNVFQIVQTNDPSSGGDLEFRFNAPFTADYQVSALLYCPDGGSNSFYINIDAQPIDPTMIWDVPITTPRPGAPPQTLERRTASWRGTATGASPPQFDPKIWHLTQGEHLFVIRGREANAIIGAITIGISAAWKMEPVSGDWNNASNWTPTTVPNGPADRATFGMSAVTDVFLSANTEVSGITFNAAASPYTITAGSMHALTLSGAGITNLSGITQNFVADASPIGGRISFDNNATAGSLTKFTLNGGAVSGASGGFMHFRGASTAGDGDFTINQGAVSDGFIAFDDTSTAGNGTFTVNGRDVLFGQINFFASSRAGNGTFTINGGSVWFVDFSTAANAILTANGASDAHLGGGIIFYNDGSAGSATLIANGGTNGGFGGAIAFLDSSRGGAARVKLFGNGILSVSNILSGDGVTTGSIEGDGIVAFGNTPPNRLTVGSNNLSTTFSGMITGGGTSQTFTKIGTGTLSLSGANIYTGGTVVSGGTLKALHDGALGTGDVSLIASGTSLTLQNGAANNYIFDQARLSIVTGSVVNLSYTGSPEVVGFLSVDDVSKPAGLYGSAASGAPNQLPQFTGTGRILVTTPGAVSRKLHATNNYDVNLPFIGIAGIECRAPGPSISYQIVLSFGLPVTFSNASVTSGTGSVASTSGNGTQTLTANLTGVASAQKLTVTFSGVNYGAATWDVPIQMSVLIGDTTGNGQVNSTDVSQTKAESGHALTIANFREDVNVSGSVSSSDVSLVKSHSGSALPP